MNHDSEDTIIRDSRPLESIETEEIGDAFGRGAVQHLPTRQPPLRVANSSNSSSVHGTAPTASKKHIWIVAGPSGSGKTAIAQFLASKLSFPYLEGDDFHSDEARDQMSHNHSLDDNDRWPWLERVRWNSMQRLQTDDDPVTDIIVTCSALKQRYRDVIRTASFYDSAVVVRFVFLIVSEIELRRRLLGRINHYMKADMLSGQLADLEHPAEVEGDVVVVDVEGSLKQSQELVLAKVRARLLVDLT